MKPELIAVVKELRSLQVQQESFIESLPSSVSSCFWDNDYANAQGMQRDLLIDALFGDYQGDVEWFLYEWNPIRNNKFWLQNDEEIVISTEEDFYKYLETL